MIGVFDSGLGGLTVLRELTQRFRHADFVYLADHAHVPYGNRPSDEIVDFTRACVEDLFNRGARLDSNKPGTGLGLAIVRDVAEIYGGSITLEESEDMGGLLARLKLPIAQ